MTRLLTVVIAALGGATLGYALHQVLAAKEGSPLGAQIVVAAPVATAGAAAGLGLVTGRARPVLAFVAATLLATFLGDRLEQLVPGLPDQGLTPPR